MSQHYLFALLALLLGAQLATSARGQQPPQFLLRDAPKLIMPGAHEFGVSWGGGRQLSRGTRRRRSAHPVQLLPASLAQHWA